MLTPSQIAAVVCVILVLVFAAAYAYRARARNAPVSEETQLRMTLAGDVESIRSGIRTAQSQDTASANTMTSARESLTAFSESLPAVTAMYNDIHALVTAVGTYRDEALDVFENVLVPTVALSAYTSYPPAFNQTARSFAARMASDITMLQTTLPNAATRAATLLEEMAVAASAIVQRRDTVTSIVTAGLSSRATMFTSLLSDLDNLVTNEGLSTADKIDRLNMLKPIVDSWFTDAATAATYTAPYGQAVSEFTSAMNVATASLTELVNSTTAEVNAVVSRIRSRVAYNYVRAQLAAQHMARVSLPTRASGKPSGFYNGCNFILPNSGHYFPVTAAGGVGLPTLVVTDATCTVLATGQRLSRTSDGPSDGPRVVYSPTYTFNQTTCA